jgi:hypothetical protein
MADGEGIQAPLGTQGPLTWQVSQGENAGQAPGNGLIYRLTGAFARDGRIDGDVEKSHSWDSSRREAKSAIFHFGSFSSAQTLAGHPCPARAPRIFLRCPDLACASRGPEERRHVGAVKLGMAETDRDTRPADRALVEANAGVDILSAAARRTHPAHRGAGGPQQQPYRALLR